LTNSGLIQNSQRIDNTGIYDANFLADIDNDDNKALGIEIIYLQKKFHGKKSDKLFTTKLCQSQGKKTLTMFG
jgi:ATP sulfurylase